jgi:hypothetical protein
MFHVPTVSNNDPSNYIDVLGYLVKYEAAHTFVPKNKEKSKTLREIYIKDLRYIINTTSTTHYSDHFLCNIIAT